MRRNFKETKKVSKWPKGGKGRLGGASHMSPARKERRKVGKEVGEKKELKGNTLVPSLFE